MGKRSREKKERKEEEGYLPEKKYEFQSGLEKACIFIIRWGTYVVLFTPLIIHTRFFFPFVAPKTTFFRILIEIIFAAYIFLLLSRRGRYLPRINLLTIVLTLFLIVFIISSFAGVNLERSFWATYERMTGIWTMLHLFAFFIVLSSVFKKREDWEKFLGVSIIVGVLLSLYVLKGSEISTRGGGTIGNTSFMAAYLLFDVFFAIILFLSERGPWQIFAGISLAIMLPVLLIFSSARGAVTCFWLGLFLLALGYMIFSKQKVLKRTGMAIILLLIILAVSALLLQPEFLKNKVSSLFRDMKPRFTVWQMGYEAWKEKPLLGWGPENFNVPFGKNFNPCLFLSECGGEIWFDRVHNIVLDTLVTMGAIGLLSYLAIFGAVFWSVFRVLPRITERRNIFIPLGLTALLIVYFFQNLLVFDMINTYLVFFLSLAFINFLTTKSREEVGVGLKQLNPFLGSIIIIVMIFAFWLGNIKPAIAGYRIVEFLSTQNIEKGMDCFQKSLDSWMYKYEAREHFAMKMMKAIYQPIEEKSRPSFQRAFEMAEAEMEKSCKASPLDLRSRLFLGKLYAASYQFSGSQEKLLLAQKNLEKCIEISPTNQQAYWHLSEVKLAQGKSEEAFDLLKKGIDLEPRYGRAYWYLTMTYKITGQYQLALEALAQAEKVGYFWQANLQDIKEVIEIYLALNDDANLVPLYLMAIEKVPEEVQLWASLAASYANLGQFEKAREAAQKVIEINPELAPQLEEFLNTLPQ